MITISNSREISLYLNHPPSILQRNKRSPEIGENVEVAGKGVMEGDSLSLSQAPGGSPQFYPRVISKSLSPSPGYLLAYNNRGEGVTALSRQSVEKGGVDFYV